MPSTLDRFRIDLDLLQKQGHDLLRTLQGQAAIEWTKHGLSGFSELYQKWFTTAYSVINQVIPHRLKEFSDIYNGPPPKKKSSHDETEELNIQDILLNRPSYSITDQGKVSALYRRFSHQIAILGSAEEKFASTLLDIRSLTRAELFDSEIDAARELVHAGFLRPAGALAGVVLERHLSDVAKSKGFLPRAKPPTINDFLDFLKGQGAIELAVFRGIQALADVRNNCCHPKKSEPTKDDVIRMIDGVAQATKTIY